MSDLFIITGTTQGLGKSLFHSLEAKNTILSINRKDITYQQKNTYNLCLDLSVIDLAKINDFEIQLSKILTKDIKKVVFINNAFSMGTLAKIDTLDNNKIIDSFNINIVSSYLLIKSFISTTKHLKIDKRILNISSGAARKAIDGWSIYCMSKSSLEMFIESIKVEYNDYKCFNIDPGVMDTRMQSTIRDFTDGSDNEYFVELYQSDKLKEPIEIAKEIIKEYI